MEKGHLGPPPWDDAELRFAYFTDFEDAYRAIDHHPGAEADRLISELRLSVQLFNDCATDLLTTVRKFKEAAQQPQFWMWSQRDVFEDAERSIRRALFAAASAALALVGHAKRVTDKVQVAGYKSRVSDTFDPQEHTFVQGMRNFASHRSIVAPEWKQIHANRQKVTKLLLMPNFLLRGDKWTAPARAYINAHRDGIEIEELFGSYSNRVSSLYGWLFPELEASAGVRLREFRIYREKLDSFVLHSWWSMILSQVVIPRRLDPYEYLDRYLTEPELQEVQSIEARSREQVDRIISLVDYSHCCDDALRSLAYKAFGIEV